MSTDKPGERGWLWRLTHPRAVTAERGTRERVAAEAAAERDRTKAQQRAEMLAAVQEPDATPDALQRVLAEYAALTENPRFGLSSVPPEWKADFQEAIFSHPNFPPSAMIHFINGEFVTPAAVVGLLRNPVCPLLFLERPDFLHSLSGHHQTRLADLALRHPGLPPFFAQALTTVQDPWKALEAETHVALNPLSGETRLTLAALEARILSVLQGETAYVHSLCRELGEYGMLPSSLLKNIPDPLLSSVILERLTAVPPELTDRLIVILNRKRKLGDSDYGQVFEAAEKIPPLMTLLSSLAADDPEPRELANPGGHYLLCLVASHVATPPYVLASLSNCWSRKYPHVRRLVSRRTNVGTLVGQCRDKALNELRLTSDDDCFDPYCPAEDYYPSSAALALAYLVLRYHPAATGVGTKRNIMECLIKHLKSGSRLGFILGLIVALYLDRNNPDHTALLATLRDNPNRYVRAAARGELKS